MTIPKHAFITGGAQRVGREVALHLAREGYDITLHYCNARKAAEATAAQVHALGQACQLVQADFTRLADASSLFTAQPVTLLVHNAALFKKDALADVTAERLTAHMQVNALAPVLLTKAFATKLPEGMEGQVVCILDGLQGWSMSSHFLSYALSKRTLEAFVTLQAASLAPHIRLNGIRIGAVMQGDMEKARTLEKFVATAPMQRNGEVDELCNAITALEALPNMTGQVLDISGGFALPHEHITR